MRQQIDTIYDDPQPNEIAATAPQPVAQQQQDPYTQTHSESEDVKAAEQSAAVQQHWQKYHSAWQQYYQMYYERYYQAQAQKHLIDTATENLDKHREAKQEELSEEQAVGELRNELLEKVKVQSKKIRKSRHFMPAVVAVLVALVFVFLQYNQIIFANIMAYTTPASLDTVNTYVDPSTDVAVGPEPLITIPKLAVQAPVVYDLTTLDETVVESKLESGVVHYPIRGANAVPGEIGNSVFLGHSANDVFAPGNYKFVFLRLEQLQDGDYFYLNFNSKRYTYVVTGRKVITPSQVSELAISTDKPIATLVTCVPVGTSANRLLIFGEQIAPDPSKATAQTTTPETNTQEIGGGSKSFFERLFGN
jgi:sortase A